VPLSCLGQIVLGSTDVDSTSCLLLVLNLLSMDGLEVQRRINEAKYNFPIIFFTGQHDSAIETRARSAGAADFLQKAAPPSQLIAAVERALASRLV
jgi:FixJ family two-component response regulator